MQLSIVGALGLYLLKEHRSPVVSLYDLSVAALRLYARKEYAGDKIKNIRAEAPRRDNIVKFRNSMMENGILEARNDFPRNCFLLTASPFKDPFDLACGLDSFCYISHLSAMSYHGLTDRFPKRLFLTTPTTPIWKERAEAKMVKDLGENYELFKNLAFPVLNRHSFDNFNKSNVNYLVTKLADQGAYISPSDRPIRVSSIGRTFLDMLRKSELCGGMNHVIDVFTEQAKTYLPLIISEIDRHGEKIEKVRAGYILEERCNIIGNPKIESWIQFAQRGGSRVLDPSAPYWSTFSEKWCLSINVSN
ncbi:type IV toxin-antitoxin system AbiEi family antitoxin domain-containing protein [Undibacterium sp. JH2W]|uniref:type IV toxin-antitoxin system AbiEi family antitoxin domain-containing protein n=1 Tax=Undibacterium sp. JH2W TaxID=3413037 RepID=UPI003BF2B994